jgi:S1-C subfamily serine protease
MGFQRHKWWGLLLLLVPLVGHVACTAGASVPPKLDFEYSVIENVRRHTVAIAVYYTMSEIEYTKRMAQGTTRKWSLDRDHYFWKQLVVPVKVTTPQGIETPIKCLAYIGSGTVIAKNYILSVRHLFEHTENTIGMMIWVFMDGVDHPVQADVEAMSAGKVECDDYALIKPREDFRLPGLKIAPRDSAKVGDTVMATGSPGGMAFFVRFVKLTSFDWFFQTDEAGILHLSSYENFPFWCIYPSGPGDSGGSIKNLRGEIIGILYCGVTVYEENYTFSNPTGFIHDFLECNGHKDLLE